MPKLWTPRLIALHFAACIACLLSPFSGATEASICNGITLAEARFAMAVADRTPIGEMPVSIPTDHDAVFFFSDVRHGNGQTLHHRWYYQDELISDVALRIGSDRWRTWSRKRLGQRRSGDWRVEVTTEDNCTLTQQVLPAISALPVLTQARELLKQNDLIGARLLVKEKLPDNVAYRSRLEGFLNEDLAIAQIKQSIDENQLYIADARLTSLESNDSLNSGIGQHLPELRRVLENQREEIKTRTERMLSAFQQVQQRTLTGGTCPATEAELLDKLSILPNSDVLLVSDWSIADHHLEAHLLDQRTGFIHALSVACPAAMVTAAH